MKFYKIQVCRRTPIEIYKYCNTGKMVSPKRTKFGTNYPPYYKTANINVEK